MKVNIKANIQLFPVPNTVLEEPREPLPPMAVGESNPKYRPPLEYLLSELSAETLDELCEKFRIEVFNKAGIAMPPHAV